MAHNKRDLSEVFSPIKPIEFPDRPKTPKTPTPSNQKEKEPFDAEEVRDAQLRRELEGVRNINEVIEGVIGTLERAKGNMGVRPTALVLSDMPLILPPLLALQQAKLTCFRTRASLRRSTMHPLSSTPGPASSRKRSTTNGSSSTQTGKARPMTYTTSKPRPSPNSRLPSAGLPRPSAAVRRRDGRPRTRRGPA